MTHCYIYGAGGHGKVVFHTFSSMGKTITAFLDDKPTHEQRCGLPILTPADVQDSPYTIHFAIGNNRIRHALQTAWLQLGIMAETAIHPCATRYPSATVGRGSLLTAGSIIGPDAIIGEVTHDLPDYNYRGYSSLYWCASLHLAKSSTGLTVWARTTAFSKCPSSAVCAPTHPPSPPICCKIPKLV
jgi:hypothetical protein